MAHLKNSGIQSHSAGDIFPYVIVCHGGFPTLDNDCTAEVLGTLNGEQTSFGRFGTYADAERIAKTLKSLDEGSAE